MLDPHLSIGLWPVTQHGAEKLEQSFCPVNGVLVAARIGINARTDYCLEVSAMSDEITVTTELHS